MKPKDCDHPDCTGKHGGSVSVAERCPAAIERKNKRERERNRERYANDPQYRERERKRKREQMRERYANDSEFREAMKKRNAKLRAERQAQGLCPGCGKRPPNGYRCDDCTDGNRIGTARYDASAKGITTRIAYKARQRDTTLLGQTFTWD